MLKKTTFFRWLMALTFGVFLLSGAIAQAQDGRSIDGSYVEGLTAFYSPGVSGYVLEFETHAVSPDFEWVVYAELDFPDGVTIVSATDMSAGGSRVLPYNGETGNGALVTWGALSGYGSNWLTNGNVAAFSVTVNVAEDFTGDLTIDWMLHGDVYGADPHTVTGTVIFEEAPFPYPVDFVMATELSDDQVLLQWGFDPDDFIPDPYPFNTDGMTQQQIDKNWNAYKDDHNIVSSGNIVNNRSVVGYQVWREKVYLPGDFELLGTTSQSQFVDFAWGDQDWGVYRWHVVVLYELNQSEPTASNTLDKDMTTSVSVLVQTNSGDSPAGTLVEFTNISEPELEIIYSVVLPASGAFSRDDFRKGAYDIEIFLPGYEALSFSNVAIMEDMNFNWVLVEIIAPPVDLYVTPTGYATWSSGTAVPFEPFFEDFNEGVPADWTIELGPTATVDDNWFLAQPTTAQSIDDTPYMRIDSDAAGSGSKYVHGLMYTPAIDASNADALYLEFDQYYRHLGNSRGIVQVYDGNDWVEVLFQSATSGTWTAPNHQVIDVTDYANADFQVRFEYYDGSSWAWYWVVDNVVVTDISSRKLSRGFEHFKVFLNNVLVAETQLEEYQFGTNGEVLVDGNTYLAEIAAVYSTGQSTKVPFTFIYMGCNNYAVPLDFTAEQLIGTVDVALNWTLPEIELDGQTNHNMGLDLKVDPAIAGQITSIGQSNSLNPAFRTDELLWGANWEDPPASTNGIISTYYGGLSAATMSADDFVVPAGVEWDISSIWARGFLSAGVPAPEGYGYSIYANNEGQPGDLLYEDIVLGSFTLPLVQIDLDTPITLEPGTYWIAVYGYYSTASATTQGRWNQYMWNPATTPGNLAMLSDFANLFGMAANGWMTLQSLGVDFTSLDFALFGEVVIDEPSGPTVNEPIAFTRIWRNGEVIAEVTDETYLDAGLALGTYNYCLTLVYESGAETCLGSVCEQVEVTGNATVNGNVMQAAYLGGSPIEGATVMVFNDENSFSFTTNANGDYTGSVLAGTYNYEVSATDYTTETLSGVVIPEASTITNDFVLMEFPYPAGDVVAVELSDATVEITWRSAGSGFETYFEDFEANDGGWVSGAVSGLDHWEWGTPAQANLNGAYSGVNAWATRLTANYDNNANTWLMRQFDFSAAENPYFSVQLLLYSEPGWDGMILEYSLNGTSWNKVMGDPGFYNNTSTSGPLPPPKWSGRFASYQLFETSMPEVAGEANVWLRFRFASDGSVQDQGIAIDDIMIIDMPMASKMPPPVSTLQGYNVYRTSCEDGGNMQFLGFTLDTTFNDNTWGTAASGVYKWGVEAVYAENESEVEFSNCLDKNMTTMVSVLVQTNSGDSPEGTNVLFVNTSEPDLEVSYAVELDESGYYLWEDFRKGTYDITVELLGFASIELTDVLINIPIDFQWILEEMLLPVSDLYVTPTGFATWRSGGIIPFEPFMEDFSGGIGEWTIDPVVTNWQISQTTLAGGVAPEVRFYWSPSSTGRYSFVSPVMSTLTQTQLELSFKHFLSHFSGAYTLELITIANGEEYLVEEWVNPTGWPAQTYTTMLTAAHGVGADEFQIGFVFEGNTFNINWWNIDDILIQTPRSRDLVNYTVYLDGVVKGTTEVEYYQYLDLEDGETYLAEVAANYTTGTSPKMAYEFTYFSCENFDGPEDLTAEVENNKNVILNWGAPAPPPPPGGDWFELSYHNGVPSNAFYQQYNYGYGVVYDLSGYTNVTVEKLDYRHSPWGIFGTWNYKLHVVDWDTYTLLHTTDVMQSTIDNGWELDIELGSIPESGLVGIFLEPMSNSPTDAYPCLDGDQMATTNSFYGALPNWSGMANAGTVGNFLMDLWILAETAKSGQAQMIKAPKLDASGTASIAETRNANSQIATSEISLADADRYAKPRHVKPSRDTWDVQFEYNLEAITGALGNAGAETDGEHFYTSRWASNLIHKISMDGNLVEEFSIPGVTGIRDMAYDGEYFYGSNAGAGTGIWQMDFETKTLVSTIPCSFGVRSISYDPENDAFWVNNWSEQLRLISRTGTVLQTISTAPPSMYGSAYDEWSEGGPYLWIFTGTTTGGGCQVEQLDLNTGTLTGVSHSVSGNIGGNGIAGGLWTQPGIVPNTVTLGGLSQGTPDMLFGFELIEDDNGGGGGGGGFDWEYLGANIYRNGELIAEQVQGETYTDFDLLPGDYEYCVTFVYEQGAESCLGDACVDVVVSCDPPKNLEGIYVWDYNQGDPYEAALIRWEPSVPPVAAWLYYDDGINVDGIGGPAAFTWAIKFDPPQLAEYEGASLTKIQIYNRLASTDELRIYEGTNAATLLHTQPLAGLPVEAWSEVDLTSPVLLDVTKQLWIAVYTTDGVNFPAGCGVGQNQPNGDLITLDGVLWEHLTDYGLNYTWNLRGYVTTMAGVTMALPMEKPADRLGLVPPAELAISGQGSGENSVLDLGGSRAVDAFNIYRSTSEGNYTLLATVPFEAGMTSYEYLDTDVETHIGYYYQVTAHYTYEEDVECESPPAMSLLIPEDDFVYVYITGVEELSQAEARIYPNPANNSINIEAKDMQRITIVNAVGQMVYDKELDQLSKVTLNTASYEAGMYILRIATSNGMVTKRMTIIR